MKIQFKAGMMAVVLAGGLMLAAPVRAEDNSFRMAPNETLSIGTILKMIGNVNLKQSDIKTNQTLENVMEMKSQVYSSQEARTVPGLRKQPPSPLRKAI